MSFLNDIHFGQTIGGRGSQLFQLPVNVNNCARLSHASHSIDLVRNRAQVETPIKLGGDTDVLEK